MEYDEFLSSKLDTFEPVGFEPPDLLLDLFGFQEDIVRWAVRNGRGAIFADCGLGKTPMQLDWCRLVSSHTSKPVLIVAPLAVSEQTRKEGEKFNIPVTVCRSSEDIEPGVNITNYEMLSHFDSAPLGGIALDESSILKGFDGKTRAQLNEFATNIGFRLCCTATPAPNDLLEIINHSEFLGIARSKEILALYFRQDGNTTHKWRLKGHAEESFWKWLASWSVALRSPQDLGYPDESERFDLPPKYTHEHIVDSIPEDGMLFPVEAHTMHERRKARQASIADRVQCAAGLVAAEPDEQWLLWCNLNAESAALTAAIPGAVEVKGSDSRDHKAAALAGFQSGDVQYLVTKPSIAGFGMNWQNCARAAFVGLSDSYEQFYQALRRIWRFGQERPVHAHIVIAEAEGAVLANVQRKERECAAMFDSLLDHVSIHQLDRQRRGVMTVSEDAICADEWTLLMGDSCKRLDELEPESIGLWVFSPPFPGMYAYTNAAEDVGNSKSTNELLEHLRFMVPKLLAATMPGRSCCIHLTQEPVFKGREGYTGRRDFRGRTIDLMESEGWIYTSEVTIDKNPQVKAARTKDHALLFKTLGQDSSASSPCMADYLLIFRKPGDNTDPIAAGMHPRWNPDGGWITSEEWIEWAAPVWYRAVDGYPGGIRETDVLQVRHAREDKDEKHLCPLQLGVIERAVKLWSNPGDLVGDPFAGIGSTGHVALTHHRQFWGCELKRTYWEAAARTLEDAVRTRKGQLGLYSEAS